MRNTTLKENNMPNGRGFALVVNAPNCPTCGATQQGRSYISFNEVENDLLIKAGMFVGHPAQFWEGMPAEQAAQELYRLKAVMLKKPLEFMMLARENTRGSDAGYYERLIFKIDEFCAAPKAADGIVSVDR